MMYGLVKKATLPTVFASVGSVGAYAAPITVNDTFDYVDQSAFDAVYTTTTTGPGTGSVSLNPNTNQNDVDLSVTGLTGTSARFTNTSTDFVLTSSDGADLTFTTDVPFSNFGRARIGLSSVDDSSDQIILEIYGNNGGDQTAALISIFRTVDGVNTSIGAAATNLGRVGTFSLEIGETTVTALKDGAEITGLIDLTHNLDYTNFTSGANVFVELEAQSNSATATRSLTVDDLIVTAVVPEPSTLSLATLGVVAVVVRRRRAH